MFKNNKKDIKQLPKLIVILGPTASGKTSWSLKLAHKINGEIIVADSRQIYKKMTIGTAKVLGEWKWNGLKKVYYVKNIPHYLIDFLDPGKTFTVAEFRDSAIKYIKLIHRHKNIPIIVGGTGLFIHAVVDNLQIPRVPPNKKLRKSFEEKDNEELMNLLKQLDPKTALSVDPNNKRRIIRALEVCILSGEPFSEQQKKGEPLFNILQIGIKMDRDLLYKRIDRRVEGMVDEGLVEEIHNLLKQKYTWDLPSMSGIGYRQFKGYFENKYDLEEAKRQLKKDTRRYAKRQITWFKRDKRIKWCEDYTEAEKLVLNFLNN